MPLLNRIRRLTVTVALTLAALPCDAGAEETQLDRMRARVSAYVGSMMEKLGGSRIVYRVDTEGLRESVVTELRDEVYKALRDNRIAFSGLSLRDGSVELHIADAGSRAQLVRKLAAAAEGLPSNALTMSEEADGLLRLSPTDAAFAARQRDLVEDAIAMIEQRLKEIDVKLAAVRPEGPDRISIFVPGLMDPLRVTALFARKVRVSFRLVDVSVSAEQAQQAGPPAGSEVLIGFKDKRPYLVARDSVLEGEDISYAGPGLAAGTQEPIASFRFNGRGTRRFAHVTAENIGKPFAIVLNDKVLAAPVIREPITGGTGQISGNFTLEEANGVAMLLRAGALPGHLGLVEQQVVQPAARP